MSFGEAILREILQNGSYAVLCSEGQLSPSTFLGVRRAEDIAIAVLRKYMAAFYDRRRRSWEQGKMELATLTSEDPNLQFGGYMLRVKTTNNAFLMQVRRLVNDAKEIYEKDIASFPNIHFDRHLYQPLIVTDRQERMEATPPALNEGEAKFVRDLRIYLQTQKAEIEGKQVFLLRNLTRGRGIGFFEAGEGEAFYPDFILWLIHDKQQRITFIDPHGLRMARGGFNDPKVRLHQSLKALETTLQQQGSQWQVHLASFIIAPGSYEETKSFFGTGQHSREEFEANNILFAEDSEYIKKLFDKVLEGYFPA